MRVSRPSLVYDRLVDFEVSDRFLKLPIERFLELEGIDPLEPQMAMINAVNDPAYKQIVGCLSRRTGKTFIANAMAFLKAMEPNSNVLIVSPNYSLTNISWNEQVRLLAKHRIEIKSKNKTDREIHLENGSMIKFGSAAQADSLVGRSYDLIIFDEAAIEDAGRDAYNIQLRPTLDRPGSKIVFISTPRGTANYFFEFYNRGFSEEFPTWVSVHSTYKDNPRMLPSDVEEARRSMGRMEFEQEYEASFVSFEGQIYDAFDEDLHVIAGLREDIYTRWKENPYLFEAILGIDPGYKDDTGAVLLIYEGDVDRFYLVWDYSFNERTTAQHAAAFNAVFTEWDVDMVFIDSAAAQFREDLSVMYDIPSNAAIKSVLDGIAYVQTIVDNDRLYVDASCEKAIMMLKNYRWDSNDKLIKPRPVHDKFSHLADALRYALYSLSR